MPIPASTIVADVQRILNDETGVRVAASQLVPLLNQAQRDIMTARPDTTAVISALALVAGVKQAVPSNAYLLIDIHSNTAAPYAPVTKVDLPLLDASEPGWRNRAQSSSIKHFMHDLRNPRVFWVYPPATAGIEVEFEASIYPDDIPAPVAPGEMADTVVGNISLNDEWQTALFCMTAHYAYLTDLEGVNNQTLAVAYLQRASSILGAQIQTAAATTANN